MKSSGNDEKLHHGVEISEPPVAPCDLNIAALFDPPYSMS